MLQKCGVNVAKQLHVENSSELQRNCNALVTWILQAKSQNLFEKLIKYSE
jgi:hypothetical protein